MQIESILIFIVFVVISSFANKRKEAQHKQRQQQKREVQTQQTQPQKSQVQTQSTQAKQQKPVKRTLQDLFREMQQEMETEYKKATEVTGEGKKQVPASIQKKKAPSTPSTYKSAEKHLKPSFVNKKSPVYKDEIKDQSVEVGFNMTEEAILNGIIFSEVIGKPKAMRS